MPTALGVRNGDFGRLALIAFDRSLVVHAHAQPHLLLKVDGADTGFEVRGRRLPLTASHAVAVEPWAPHAYPHELGRDESLILAVYVDSAWLEATLGWRWPSTNSVGLDEAGQAAAQRLTGLMRGGGALPATAGEALAEVLGNLRPCPNEPPSRPIDARVRRALAYMQDHLDARCDIETVARAAGVSRPHFFELFRRDVGLGPAVYWNGLRMEQAIAAAGGGESMTNVSLDLGFSAPSNFTRFFRDIQGISPSDYRRALHGPTKPTER